MKKTFDSDFDQDPKAHKVRRGPRPYDGDMRGVMHPNAIPHPRRGGRDIPRDFGYGAGPGFNPRNFDGRADRPYPNSRPGPPSKYDKYEREDRPGFFAGNRDFRADKFRNQPLQKSSSNFKNEEIEKERIQAKKDRLNREKRDFRNRPQINH